MNDDADARADVFVSQLERVRPVTRRLIEAILLDMWPDHTAIVDFGIDSQEHYEALYYPIRDGEIMPQALDDALGHGEKLTTLTRNAASNPHRDVEFSTSWDVVREFEGQGGANTSAGPPEPGHPEITRSGRVETAGERDARHQYLLFNGVPMPQGWKLPFLTEPPDRTDAGSLGRAVAEVESLKAARFESWRRVPLGVGVGAEPGKSGRWDEMAEIGKLDVMQHWVDWNGVSRADRAGMMSAQLDLEKLSPDLRDQLRKDAALHPPGARRVEGQGFEATPNRVRSPSEIAQQSRSAGPQQPDGKANGQSREKDRSEGR